MQIRVGYELVFDCPQPVPMMLAVNVHSTRRSDLLVPDDLTTDPLVPVSTYLDHFDNVCSRIVAPAGRIKLSSRAVVRDSGEPDPVAPWAQQVPVEQLPEETLAFLLGSRYCETDRLSAMAWSLFGHTALGWARVHAICDFVHKHIAFGYQHARSTKTAWAAYQEKAGVCRDFTHLVSDVRMTGRASLQYRLPFDRLGLGERLLTFAGLPAGVDVANLLYPSRPRTALCQPPPVQRWHNAR